MVPRVGPLSTLTRHSRHKLQIHAQCPAPQPRTAHRAVHHATPAPHGRATPRADRTRDTPTHRTAATPVTATRHSATAPDRGTGPLLAAERWHRGPHTPQYTQITLYWNAKTKYLRHITIKRTTMHTIIHCTSLRVPICISHRAHGRHRYLSTCGDRSSVQNRLCCVYANPGGWKAAAQHARPSPGRPVHQIGVTSTLQKAARFFEHLNWCHAFSGECCSLKEPCKNHWIREKNWQCNQDTKQ